MQFKGNQQESQTSRRKFVSTTKDRNEFHEKYSAIDHEKHPTGEIVYHYGGDKYITYYSNVQYTEWSIRISENLSEQKRDMWSFVLWIVLVLLVLCVGAIVSEIFLTNHILHPIQNAQQNMVSRLLLDVDDFKKFNTEYGHQQGDEILCYVAQTLQSLFPGEVGRIGGDEFVFCYVGEISGEQIKADANTVIERLAEEYQSSTEDCHMAITGSLGVVTTKKSLDYIELVRCADLAMYRAKGQGKNIAVVLEV